MKDIKVLVVEDDDLLRGVLKERISRLCNTVFIAEDGEEALQKVKECVPDLVLLDLLLPGIDGFEVLAEMKKDEKLKNIPVVVVSNLGEKRDVRRAIELGASGFFIKAHYTLDEIVKKAFIVFEKSQEKKSK